MVFQWLSVHLRRPRRVSVEVCHFSSWGWKQLCAMDCPHCSEENPDASKRRHQAMVSAIALMNRTWRQTERESHHIEVVHVPDSPVRSRSPRRASGGTASSGAQGGPRPTQAPPAGKGTKSATATVEPHRHLRAVAGGDGLPRGDEAVEAKAALLDRVQHDALPWEGDL
eukprot:1864963-Amphidinium_carterae.1